VFGGITIDGRSLGAVGLAMGSGMAAWLEWGLLRRALRKRIGTVGASASAVARMFAAALSAAAAGWGVRMLLPEIHPILDALFIFSVYGVVYFAVAYVLGLGEVQGIVTRIRGLARR
jgi:putative peptidoglycan lipid II flippase